MKPDAFLEQGARVVAERLEPLGFEFAVTQPARDSSGGPFARATFKRGEREIELWARHERLGGVLYRLGSAEFTHQDYMRALGREKVACYPGFDDGDPFGGFKRLVQDLDTCDDFLVGDASAVVERVRSLPPRKTGFTAIGS